MNRRCRPERGASAVVTPAAVSTQARIVRSGIERRTVCSPGAAARPLTRFSISSRAAGPVVSSGSPAGVLTG